MRSYCLSTSCGLFVRFLLLCFVFVGMGHLHLQAQVDTNPLPENQEALVAEIEKILSYQNQSEPLAIFEQFKKNVKAKRVNTEHYTAIVSLGNEMIKRKMKRYNYFKHLIATMNAFIEEPDYSSKYLNQYLEISIRLLEEHVDKKDQFKEKKDLYFNYEEYLKFSTYFWVNKNLYQAGSGGGHVWRTESQDFIMKYDSVLSITYNDTKLFCYNKADSLIIHNAKGVYYPHDNRWEGTRGRVEWNQEGAMDAYCELNSYSINMRNTEYKSENAVLSYNSIIKKPLEGIVRDRIAKRKPTDMRTPSFESHNRDVVLDNIGDGVTYEGGFSLRGSTVRGFGDAQKKSTVTIHDKTNKRVIRATAAAFDIIRGERVISDDAEVSIYIYAEAPDTHSIYHPNIRMTYSIPKREVELTRGASIASKVPFFNSYQRMEINTPVIKWHIDSTTVNLGDDKQDVTFDSETFFDRAIFDRYQPSSTYNYIIIFSGYSEKLAQHKEELEKHGPEMPDGSSMDDIYKDVCDAYPEVCSPHPITGKMLPTDIIEKEQQALANAEVEAAENATKSQGIDPHNIHANILARLLDKRLEGKEFLTPKEFREKEKAMEQKLGPNFRKTPNYKAFRDRYVDIAQVELLTPRPSHTIDNTMRLFYDMMADGFLIYSPTDTIVSLRPKIFHYRHSANTTDNQYDFDKLRIKSVRGDSKKRQQNASIDLATGSIEVGNVREFILSESKRVIANLDAASNTATLKKGRDLDFSGDLYAGLFQFTGRSFHFNYENFEVEMDSIDAIFVRIFKRFSYDEIIPEDEITDEQRGRFTNLHYYDLEEGPNGPEKIYSNQKVLINNRIVNTRGVLKIDIANNKSGRQKQKDTEKLPDFDSGAESPAGFVYFDNPENIHGEEAYPRENFFYEIAAPFVRDSLLSFAPESWRIKGKFTSDNIFPVIDEPLRIMFHDLSFGFERETPKDGLPIYLRDEPQGKGIYKGIFGMSNEGLLGKGNLTYLGANIESEYIVFFPELFKAFDVENFHLDPSTQDGVEFPKVDGKEVIIDWAPYSDSMYIQSNLENNDEPFYLFDKGEHTLVGALILTPQGLLGEGEFEWDEGYLKSNPGSNFRFGSFDVYSPSTLARIKSTGKSHFAFENDDVEATIDFTKRFGDFISNNKDLSSDLPYNAYKTSLDRFYWEMDKHQIIIESTEGKAGFFLATEQVQDSLFFMGERADYDLNTGLLRIDGVEHIRVADAFIYPENQHVEIEERAHMRTLVNSKVVADTSNQNHVIQNATINILSRREYNANGYLEFNIDGHKEQQIKFDNVRVEQIGENFVTQGSGSVQEEDQFYLDKKTLFKGNVDLSAESKDLVFKGYAKLTSEALPIKEWFAIDSRIDKKNVGISYNEPQSPDGQTLYTGIYLNSEEGTVYPAIMAPKREISDRSIFSVTGLVHYNNKDDAYMFGDSAKIFTQETDREPLAGKKMTVAEKTSKVTAEGKFDFQQGFNRAGMPFVGVDAIGDFSFFLNKASQLRFDVALNIDMALPTLITDAVSQELLADMAIVEPIFYTNMANIRLKRYLLEFLGADKFEKIWKKVEEDNRLNLPSDFPHTFFFTKMTLAWSEKNQSFVSIGNVQLASLAGKHIGQTIQGGVEIIPDPIKGDILNFYIIAPSGEWYYFSYQGDLVRTASSKPEYANNITAMKAKDKKVKTSNGESIKIDISNAGEYNAMKNRVLNGF